MEAKDKQRNTGSNTKLAAKILLSALAFIMFCIGLVLLVSPGKIWSGYVGVVNGLLLVLLVISMFCIAVSESTIAIGKAKQIMISKWLMGYSAAIISLFMANGWWRSENIDIIYSWILKPMGLYSEGYLAVKILGLIIVATATALLLHKIKRIIYKAIDNIEIQSGGDDTDFGEGGKNPGTTTASGEGGKNPGTTTTSGGKGGRTDKKSKFDWKKWFVVGIVAAIIVILIAVLLMHPKIANLIEKQDDGTIKDILSILSPLISIVASILSASVALIPIAVALFTFGFVYRTGAIIFKNIIKWTKGDIPKFSEWLPGFISWTISIAIVFGITQSTSINGIINAFASKLSGIEPVKTFVAIILALFVAWILQEIIRLFIEVAYEIGGHPLNKGKKTKNIIVRLEKIFEDLIDIALDIISDTLSLAKIVPSFVKNITSLIDSGENNPDEIEEIIVKSKKFVLEKDPESEAFHVDLNNYCADLYDEYIKNSKLTNEPTDDSDEKEPSEDNSSEEEN